MDYFNKIRGTTASQPRVSLSEVFWSWLGAFLGIGAVAFINYNLLTKSDLLMLVIALLVNNIPKTRRYPEFWW
jgi:hypothetical protein